MTRLPGPDLQWRDGAPASARFDDVYFSGDGLAETDHVFLGGIGAPELWKGRRRFCIAETGFGTGLNFLRAWQLWRDTAPAEARLDYVSVEGFPLSAAELERAHAAFPGLGELASALRAALPADVSGYHLCRLDGGRVRLLLLYGEVREMLADLAARVDAWFLDGFAPAKNPDMWTPEVFTEIARLTVPGGRLATFTAAGAVRRGLEGVGFSMDKRPGHGAKRECLSGTMQKRPSSASSAPWYVLPAPAADGPVAVIGAGIAGCTVARSLSDAGIETTIYESSGGRAAGASGNPGAIVQPRPLAGNDANGVFHAAAYRHALSSYDELQATGPEIWRHRGLLVLGRDAGDAARYRRLVDEGPFTQDEAVWLDAAAASARAGLDLPFGGAWFPGGGVIETSTLCEVLSAGAALRTDAEISRLEPISGGWQLVDESGNAIGEAVAVVVAAGPASLAVSGAAGLGLFANRGQLSLLPSIPATANQKAAVTYGGYLTPPADIGLGAPRHVIGSTFERVSDADTLSWQEPRTADDLANLTLLTDRLPGLASFSADSADQWVGLRATTQDRFPMLGGVPDVAAFENAYTEIRHGTAGREFPPAPYRQGLWCLSGLGSRGFMTGPLCAEILVAQMLGAPIPQPRAMLDAMHPARFLIRHLKRGGRRATMHETQEE